jgi:hypothetical protein
MTEDNAMRVDAGRAKILASNLQFVSERVSKVATGRCVSCHTKLDIDLLQVQQDNTILLRKQRTELYI